MKSRHSHPCAHCAAYVLCDGELERNHDGIPPVICLTYHQSGGRIREWLCDTCRKEQDHEQTL